jgi:hypothetical protein
VTETASTIAQLNHRDLLGRPAEFLDRNRGVGDLCGLVLGTRGDQIDRLGDLTDGRRRLFGRR